MKLRACHGASSQLQSEIEKEINKQKLAKGRSKWLEENANLLHIRGVNARSKVSKRQYMISGFLLMGIYKKRTW
jgi:hypothetical protein